MPMSPRRIRRSLQAATACLWLGMGAFGYWAVTDVPGSLDAEADEVAVSRPRDTNAQSSTQSVAIDLANPVWSRQLRGPLVDPPPKPKPKPAVVARPAPKPRPVVKPTPRVTPKPPPTPTVTLVGTILEEGRSMAVIMDAEGQIDLKPEGGILDLKPDGVRVERIAADTVLVSYQSHETRLKLKAGRAKAGAAKRRNKR